MRHHRTRIPAAASGRRYRVANALLRGFLTRCPRCGIGSYRAGYLVVAPACRHCGEALGHIRADDGPAYFTLLIVAHLTVPASLAVEQAWHPPLLLHMAAAVVAAVVLVWLLLPRVKGAMVGLMWALGLSGSERQGDPNRHG
jgi:uncharacterized protein (DUF983 family)